MLERPRVMADGPLPGALEAALRQHVELTEWSAQPDASAGAIRGLFTYAHPPVTPSLLDQLPHLVVISNHGVGVDHIDLAAARDRAIPVGNTPDVLDGAVADLAFALLLAAARRLPESARMAADRQRVEFLTAQPLGDDVHGSTLGIVGLGRIGREIARRAQGFQMTVVYHNRRPDPTAEAELGVRYVTLVELLARADFVVLAVPLTAATRGLIGARELQQMKSTATLVNVSRGPVVDTDALLVALQNGQLRRAALDVTDPEPLPSDHPLRDCEQVLITSHIGSATWQTRQRMADLAVDNLLRGLRGQPLLAQVGE